MEAVALFDLVLLSTPGGFQFVLLEITPKWVSVGHLPASLPVRQVWVEPVAQAGPVLVPHPGAVGAGPGLYAGPARLGWGLPLGPPNLLRRGSKDAWRHPGAGSQDGAAESGAATP